MSALSRRGAFGAAFAAALASGASGAQSGAGESPLATFDDLARLEFEGVAGAKDALGSRENWMAGAAEWWVTMHLCAAILEFDHVELSTRAAELTDVQLELAVAASKTADYFAGCAEALRSVEVRIMAAVARHIAAHGDA